MKPLSIIILAAGVGKRMKSNLPKPLHAIGGKPMLAHVVETARKLTPQKLIVVYGHQGALLQEPFANDHDLIWAEQKTFEGTGDALRYALPFCDPDSNILVLYGDTPLVDQKTLEALANRANETTLAWLTVYLEDPTGYGRMIRDEKNRVIAITEQKDANPSELNIKEVNSGLFVAPYHFLAEALPKLTNNNQQKEYYLTDIVAIAYEQNFSIQSVTGDSNRVQGVNDRLQLAKLEAIYQHYKSQELMLNGITIIDPKRLTLRGSITHGTDCIIDCDVILEGDITLGNSVQIGMGCIIKNSEIGDNTIIHPYSIIENARLGMAVNVGPFARLREKTVLGNYSRIGNFVETKNTTVGEHSKANHLTYLGDTTIGKQANIGAGTITCNYDGANKHKTVIKDSAFIGSNSSLVAPVSIGENSTVAASSVITQDIPDNTLALTRAPLKIVSGWERPKKLEK